MAWPETTMNVARLLKACNRFKIFEVHCFMFKLPTLYIQRLRAISSAMRKTITWEELAASKSPTLVFHVQSLTPNITTPDENEQGSRNERMKQRNQTKPIMIPVPQLAIT
jgi:hypothetical protein